jgi:hypothetical protein
MASDPPTDQDPKPCHSEPGMNGWPVNSAARRMLIEAGEPPDEGGGLYIFQLALWALKTGRAEAEADLLETLNAMTVWGPERTMNFLLLREEGEEYEPPAWREAKDALHLALLIIDDIEQKMVFHFPWYRSFD